MQGRRGKDEETSGDAEQLLLASLMAVNSREGSASSLSVLSPPRNASVNEFSPDSLFALKHK